MSSFNVNIIVENRVRRSVHVDDISAPIECNRGQVHRIKHVNAGRARFTRARNGGYFDQAPGEGRETLFFSV
jgi:hypothetical protein